MSLVVPFPSQLVQLAALKPTFNNLTLRLYRNDYVPDEESETLDFTEANFSGYLAQAANNWGIPFTDDDRGRINEVVHNFAHNGGAVSNNIYGYYLTYPDGSLAWAERNPFAPVAVGPTVTYVVLPTYTLRTDS